LAENYTFVHDLLSIQNKDVRFIIGSLLVVTVTSFVLCENVKNQKTETINVFWVFLFT